MDGSRAHDPPQNASSALPDGKSPDSISGRLREEALDHTALEGVPGEHLTCPLPLGMRQWFMISARTRGPGLDLGPGLRHAMYGSVQDGPIEAECPNRCPE